MYGRRLRMYNDVHMGEPHTKHNYNYTAVQNPQIYIYVPSVRRLRTYNNVHVAICVSRSRTYNPSSTCTGCFPVNDGDSSENLNS